MLQFTAALKNNPWARKRLKELTLDQKIGQMICPAIRPRHDLSKYPENEHLSSILKYKEIEPGAVFVFSGTREEIRYSVDKIQNTLSTPALIAADLETNPTVIKEGTYFPRAMALSAANHPEYTFEAGRSSAIEGRNCGINWAFGPVADINRNYANPIMNIRTFGDDTNRVLKYSSEYVRGMQENGMCAAAKHFPGDGIDDRDQHICTSINSLSMEEWKKESGRVFEGLIKAGIWSVMVGHIALPACDDGGSDNINDAPPATLSYKITTELLRNQLGFDGVIVTDAISMGGVISRDTLENCLIKTIQAGSDMILFVNFLMDYKRSFDIIKSAVECGVITEKRIDESVLRILTLKEMLRLNQKEYYAELPSSLKEHFEETARKAVKDSITVVKDRDHTLPLRLKNGSRVLWIDVKKEESTPTDEAADCLKKEGIIADRFSSEHPDDFPPIENLSSYDAVIINFCYFPSYATNSIRPGGTVMRKVFEILYKCKSPAVAISYGTPYIAYELPHIPALINAYSDEKDAQRAVMDVVLGKEKPTGVSPMQAFRK